MSEQKKYWDKKIKEWSKSSYQGKSHNFIEWLAGFFRGPITGRMEVALEIIGPKAQGKIIADLGCGIGNFCFKILKYQPKRVIGFDISSVAIKEAKKRAKQNEVENKVQFVQGDLGQSIIFPQFDLCVGLGFIDYLNREELINLFRNLHGRYFFFSFPEKKVTVINVLQNIYLKTQNCPGAYKYLRTEIKKIAPNNNFYFIQKGKLVFITNL